MFPWFARGLFYVYVKASGGKFFEEARELERSQWFSQNKLKEIQWQNLKGLLAFSSETVPFYQDRFNRYNLSAKSIKAIEDFRKIPLLTKEEIRLNADRLRSNAYRGRVIKYSSSGSSGEPLVIALGTSTYGSYRAAQYRGFKWYGVTLGDCGARIWGVPLVSEKEHIGKIKDRLMNRVSLSAFTLSPQSMGRFFEGCVRFKARYLYGYASALCKFAQFVKGHRLDAKRLALRVVISTSEKLYDFQRETITSTFGCPVANEYGAAEVGVIAFECPKGKMHISCENVYLEFLKGSEPAAPGEPGEIVATSLKNYYMPFIRYKLGDIGRYSTETCRCGRGLPLLEVVEGRDNDIAVAADGTLVHSEIFSYMNRVLTDQGVGIREFKIIQKSRKDLRVLVVKDPGIDERAVVYLKAQIHKFLGEEISVTVEYVDKILPEKSGKVRYFVSELTSNDISG